MRRDKRPNFAIYAGCDIQEWANNKRAAKMLAKEYLREDKTLHDALVLKVIATFERGERK